MSKNTEETTIPISNVVDDHHLEKKHKKKKKKKKEKRTKTSIPPSDKIVTDDEDVEAAPACDKVATDFEDDVVSMENKKKKKKRKSDEGSSSDAEKTPPPNTLVKSENTTTIIQKFWTDDAEITVLEALHDFAIKIGECNPLKKTQVQEFYDCVKGSLNISVDCAQVKSKIEKLKADYNKHRAGERSNFRTAHKKALFQLSDKIWGGTELKTRGEEGQELTQYQKMKLQFLKRIADAMDGN